MYDKGILLYFNYELICFGQLEYNKNMQTINFIIYLMKYYIFKLKIMHQPYDFNIVLTFLKLRFDIEQEIALKNDNLEQFNTINQRLLDGQF